MGPAEDPYPTLLAAKNERREEEGKRLNSLNRLIFFILFSLTFHFLFSCPSCLQILDVSTVC